MTPETRYARSGDVSIAYQVTGEGPFDVVYVPPFVTHLELAWNVPVLRGWFERLGSFSRLIRFDKRGTGMSDDMGDAPTLETRMDDVRAVMDAAESDRAAIIGVSEGGPMSVCFAATYPHRVWALVLEATFPRTLWASDYPWGVLPEDFDRSIAETAQTWASPERMAAAIESSAPSADEESKHALATMVRLGAGPGTVTALRRTNRGIDVRGILHAVRVPTLVINRTRDYPGVVAGSRYLAEHIAGARHIEIPGSDHALFATQPELGMTEIQRFLEEAWEDRLWDRDTERVLATVLFTDIVGSSALAIELGDRRWKELLEQHHALVRRHLNRFRGKELDTAGDGFFASFDGPARAIRCACAISADVRRLGLEIRAGLHAGECELIDGKVGGVAVHIGARVAANAEAGEVVVSSTVKDLVAGSGISFTEREAVELKGIPGEWKLFTVARAD
jgi:class 3 adenylate cyclase/alpha-beta hydrolase superfamily lysophospholipase